MRTNRYYHGPRSDHFDGERFFNVGQQTTDRGMLDVLRSRVTSERARWPAAVPSRQVVPEPRVGGLRITMVGHATVLVQAAGRNLLVDPVWSERASPLARVGPRRVTPPGIAFDDLPPIDAVLLTHNHYDHLDLPTLRRVWEAHRPRVVAPLGNDAVVAGAAPDIAVATRDWGQSVELDPDCVVWLTPANHWSARGTRDRRMALWCGFVVETRAGRVYVAGDTGYGDGQIFRDLRRRHAPPDVAVLPIGAYEPRSFMQEQHCDPAEAVQIMLDCGARHALGVHWGTFQLGNEARTAPREALASELARRRLSPAAFVAMAPGDVWTDGVVDHTPDGAHRSSRRSG